MSTQKNILVAALDWGLGHATRCVPLIKALDDKGYNVILASAGPALEFFRTRFPGVRSVEIPAYNIVYKTKSASLSVALQTPSMLQTIKDEQGWLREFLTNNKIEGIISDNRFGLHTDQCPVAFICHQLNPKFPWFGRFIARSTFAKHLKPFNTIWVPDQPDGISGSLSDASNIAASISHIGIQSRFAKPEVNPDPQYHWLAMVSGPEKHRTRFEQKLIGLLRDLEEPSLVLCGQPAGSRDEQIGRVRVLSHADDDQITSFISQSRNIIARSGYSTIMDLVSMGRTACLVPTPGQPEQQFLASYCHDNMWFPFCDQSDLNLSKLNLEDFRPPQVQNGLLEPVLSDWLARL